MNVTLSRQDGNYYIPVEDRIDTIQIIGKRRPSMKKLLELLGITATELNLIDKTPYRVPRNRNRADKIAAGMVAVEIWMTPAQRDALDNHAKATGVSRNATVVNWVKSL